MSERRPNPTRRAVLLGAASASLLGAGLGARRALAGPPGWDEVTPFLTDASVFYNRFDAKKFDPVFWWIRLTRSDEYPMGHRPAPLIALSVEGAVEAPRSWGAHELRDRFEADPRRILKTMQCSGDGPGARLASNGVWGGVPLRRLLDEAGVRSDAVRLRITGDDGFTAGLRLGDLRTDDGREALVAVELNGAPLPVERGGPFRLLVPDKYGFKNVKWPRRLEVTSEDVPWGNHEVVIEGGTDAGDRKIGAKILSPSIHRHRRVVRTDRRERVLRGVAFGGEGRVGRVVVTIDGARHEADISPPSELRSDPVVRAAHAAVGGGWPLRDVWTPWSLRWTPPGPGEYAISVAVENERGEVTPHEDEEYLDGDSSRARGTILVS